MDGNIDGNIDDFFMMTFGYVSSLSGGCGENAKRYLRDTHR
jgi:hypothetical protein